MSHPLPATTLLLASLGLLPFVGLSMAPRLEILPFDAALVAFLQYSALILTFLGGVHWYRGTIAQPSPLTAALALIPCLVALAALWLLNAEPALWLLGIAYLAVLGWDLAVLGATAPSGYLAMRITLTAIAVLTHALWLLT
ncbi:DUF3429 domain-containing protein [Ferrimonas gelatinilytica]|uniref:DUF3429 domain-containing protein n=1 Tax=Ferrimonas gelatinilytica TaxID=1255257 RepID=A0ABP9RTU8_9GAMM